MAVTVTTALPTYGHCVDKTFINKKLDTCNPNAFAYSSTEFQETPRCAWH